MQTSAHSKADLHVHSKYSDRPSEWFLRRIGSPECFVEPEEVYRRARQRGMDFVTISDHNCIRGSLEIAHLPGTFLSSEITTYFPENGCKVHMLCIGFTPEEFETIQELRADIYQLQKYLLAEDIISSVTHPLYRVNSRLTIDQLEKLLLMFNRFEAINGARDRRAADLVSAIFRNLTPEMIEQMADRHGIEPVGPEPWKKSFTAGSDDHSGVYIASAYTTTPHAEDVAEFLAYLRRGDHEAAGNSGGSVMMGHGFYHIAYSYYKDRFLRGDGDGKPTIVGELFKRLLEGTKKKQAQPATLAQRARDMVVSYMWSRQKSKFSEVERTLVDEFTSLFQQEPARDAASPPMEDRQTFQTACRICHTLGYGFLRRFIQYARQGQLMESLQTVASLAPMALSVAPYLAAFSTQHKDEAFLKAVAEHFPAAGDLRDLSQRKAWITDTYSDVNGVSRTIQTLGATARKVGRQLTVISCVADPPKSKVDLKNFAPVGTFRMPEYESLEVCFPPFLEILEYIERQRFGELIISTPGPMGLTGLAAARLMSLRTTGIYHTDFPLYVSYMTEDDTLTDLTWRYMLWFYEQCDTILVPSEYYRKHLMRHGFDPTKLAVMARGVDTARFSPARRDEGFFRRYGADGSFRFVYVGRVSREKNLHLLVDAFDVLLRRGQKAGLAIVGDGPYLDELKQRCAGKPVAFTGFLEGDELATAFASGDCLVFPSTSDTFGNVVLEAQASGVPVIVSDKGGPQEIVGRNDSGLIVDVQQPEALADAMQQVLQSGELREKLRARGLKNATESTWEEVLEDFWRHSDHSKLNVDPEAFRSNGSATPHALISLDVA
ncbi:MAG: glycosyltransferase [Planctomycetota bacterium]